MIIETRDIKQFEFDTRSFERYLQGDKSEIRAVTEGFASGSYTVPTTLSTLLVEKLYEVAPLLSMCRQFTSVNGYLEVLRESDLGNAGFIGEMKMAGDPATPNTAQSGYPSNAVAPGIQYADFSFKNKVKFDKKRVATAMQLSLQAINDSGLDLVSYAIKTLARRFGMTTDRNILNGDPNTQFEGILNSTAPIQTFTTALTNGISLDEIYNVYLSMNPNYLAGAVWIMYRDTYNLLLKLKDYYNRFWFIPNVIEDSPTYKLFGLPVLIADAMPGIYPGAKTIILANLYESYGVMQNGEMDLKGIFNDTIQATQGTQLYLANAYMDGKIINEEAIKILQMHT